MLLLIRRERGRSFLIGKCLDIYLYIFILKYLYLNVGYWSFSLARLNLNVVSVASMKGGCVVVDSTRKGKEFPDREVFLYLYIYIFIYYNYNECLNFKLVIGLFLSLD